MCYFYTKLKTEEIFVRLSVVLSASVLPLSNCLLGNLPGKQNPGFGSLGNIHSSTLITCSSVSSSQVPGIIFPSLPSLGPYPPPTVCPSHFIYPHLGPLRAYMLLEQTRNLFPVSTPPALIPELRQLNGTNSAGIRSSERSKWRWGGEG